MALWLIDEERTRSAGTYKFRLPYPQPAASWNKERKANQPLIEAMEAALKAAQLANKPGDKWKPDEDEFFRQMMS